jgi:hypothetical protein
MPPMYSQQGKAQYAAYVQPTRQAQYAAYVQPTRQSAVCRVCTANTASAVCRLCTANTAERSMPCMPRDEGKMNIKMGFVGRN